MTRTKIFNIVSLIFNSLVAIACILSISMIFVEERIHGFTIFSTYVTLFSFAVAFLGMHLNVWTLARKRVVKPTWYLIIRLTCVTSLIINTFLSAVFIEHGLIEKSFFLTRVIITLLMTIDFILFDIDRKIPFYSIAISPSFCALYFIIFVPLFHYEKAVPPYLYLDSLSHGWFVTSMFILCVISLSILLSAGLYYLNRLCRHGFYKTCDSTERDLIFNTLTLRKLTKEDLTEAEDTQEKVEEDSAKIEEKTEEKSVDSQLENQEPSNEIEVEPSTEIKKSSKKKTKKKTDKKVEESNIGSKPEVKGDDPVKTDEENKEDVIILPEKTSEEKVEESTVANEQEQPKEEPKKVTPKARKSSAKTSNKSKSKTVKKAIDKTNSKETEKPVEKETVKSVETPAKKVPVSKKESSGKIYHVSHHKTENKWQVKLASSSKAIKLFRTQLEAINYAKQLASNQNGSIRIHAVNGKIRKG